MIIAKNGGFIQFQSVHIHKATTQLLAANLLFIHSVSRLFGPIFEVKIMGIAVSVHILLCSRNKHLIKTILHKLIGDTPSIFGRPEHCNRCRWILIHSHSQRGSRHLVISQLFFEKEFVSVISHRHVLPPVMVHEPKPEIENGIKEDPLPPKDTIMGIVTDSKQWKWSNLIVVNISIRIVQLIIFGTDSAKSVLPKCSRNVPRTKHSVKKSFLDWIHSKKSEVTFNGNDVPGIWSEHSQSGWLPLRFCVDSVKRIDGTQWNETIGIDGMFQWIENTWNGLQRNGNNGSSDPRIVTECTFRFSGYRRWNGLSVMSPHWVLIQITTVFVVNGREWPRLIVIIRKCAVICETSASWLSFIEYVFVFSVGGTSDLFSFGKGTAWYGDEGNIWRVDWSEVFDSPKAFHVR